MKSINTKFKINNEFIQTEELIPTKIEELEGADNLQDKLISGQNIKTINNESILGKGNLEIKSNLDFNSSWVIDKTTLDFATSINEDTSATAGHTYLGGVSFTDLPAGMNNAECQVEIISSTISSNKVIHFNLYSATTKPYHWSCVYWDSKLTDWQGDVLKEDLPVANNGEATIDTLNTLEVNGVNYKLSGSEIDNQTITKNSQEQIQAVGLKYNEQLLTAEDIWLACSIERTV